MKHLILVSALVGLASVSGGCTKKMADRTPQDSGMSATPPSSIPGTTTLPSATSPATPTPAPNEMPGSSDSTNSNHSMPNDAEPRGESTMPSDTSPAPQSGTGNVYPSSPTGSNPSPTAP
ncbi:MAG: hypothetical protein H7249_05335 [Chitinophagaceae bacterium]|nr:hypothetical protein [Oligoflexus sp.]